MATQEERKNNTTPAACFLSTLASLDRFLFLLLLLCFPLPCNLHNVSSFSSAMEKYVGRYLPRVQSNRGAFSARSPWRWHFELGSLPQNENDMCLLYRIVVANI